MTSTLSTKWVGKLQNGKDSKRWKIIQNQCEAIEGDSTSESQMDNCIWCLSVHPQGLHLVFAAGNHVLVIRPSDGHIINKLNGHKGTVYCVAHNKSGSKFASGSADRCVIVWTSKLEGEIRYEHKDSVQCLSFNPVTNQLLSCSSSTFAVFSPQSTEVPKYPVSGRILSCSWSFNGENMALGYYDGTVSIRDKEGKAKMIIERREPVWTLAWSPVSDILAVADWSRTLMFYSSSGAALISEITLDYDPLCISWHITGDYLVMGGTNNCITTYSKQGFQEDRQTLPSKVWCCQLLPRHKDNTVAVGTQSGYVSMFGLTLFVHHAMHRDHYAFSNGMNTVLVKDLSGKREVVLELSGAVQGLSVYKHMLAVRQPEHTVAIYEYDRGGQEWVWKFKQTVQLPKGLDEYVVNVLHENLLLSKGRRLSLYTFEGVKEREWLLDAEFSQLHVCGGLPKRETVLIALANGQVVQVFLDNPFTVDLMTAATGVHYMSLSCDRRMIAVTDTNASMTVMDMRTKSILWTEPEVISQEFHLQLASMICYSDGENIVTKIKDIIFHQQALKHHCVITFTGNMVWYIYKHDLRFVEIPLSKAFHYLLYNDDLITAYNVACLGVTPAEWELLGHSALLKLNLGLAKKSYMETDKFNMLRVIGVLEDKQGRGDSAELLLAEVNSYFGEFETAASIFLDTDRIDKVVAMYSTLKMFDKCKAVEMSSEEQRLMKFDEAEWKSACGQFKEAVDLYVSVGEQQKAIEIAIAQNWTDVLVSLSAAVTDQDSLRRIAQHLSDQDLVSEAAEIYNRLLDPGSVIRLRMRCGHWEDALILAERCPQYKDEVFIAYAHWLCEKDQFEDAQRAFLRAGMQEHAMKFMKDLVECCMTEGRYGDVSYLLQRIASQSVDPDESQRLQAEAEVCFAYQTVVSNAHLIQRPNLPVLRAALFLLNNRTVRQLPTLKVLFVMAEQGARLGAFKLARYAYNQLQKLVIPTSMRNRIDVGCLAIKAKPYSDCQTLYDFCSFCGGLSPPMVKPQGDVCIHCQHVFVRSLISFEALPVIQFKLDPELNLSEVKELLVSERKQRNKKKQRTTCLVVDDNYTDEDQDWDIAYAEASKGVGDPLVASRDILLSLTTDEVLVVGDTVYKIGRVDLTACHGCLKLFVQEEFEEMVLFKGHCPFCRTKPEQSKED